MPDKIKKLNNLDIKNTPFKYGLQNYYVLKILIDFCTYIVELEEPKFYNGLQGYHKISK